MGQSRRAWLRTVAAGLALLSGCTSLFDSRPPAGTVVVENADERTHVVAIEAVAPSGETVETSVTVSGSGRAVESELLGPAGRWEVTARLEAGESATTDLLVGTDGGEYLRVRISGAAELVLITGGGGASD
jgi:hypothetical protein